MVPFSSASSSLARPLPTCARHFLAGRDVRSLIRFRGSLGSGLTANRENRSNASGLYPAFDLISRSPRPAPRYRPLPALRRFASRAWTVTYGSSPGLSTNRVNSRNCPRAIVVLRFSFLQSTKIARLYHLCFQSSAARPQAPARKLCSLTFGSFMKLGSGRAFRAFHKRHRRITSRRMRFANVGNPEEMSTDAELRKFKNACGALKERFLALWSRNS